MKDGIKIGNEICLNSKASVHSSLAIAPFLLKFIPPQPPHVTLFQASRNLVIFWVLSGNTQKSIPLAMLETMILKNDSIVKGTRDVE